MTILDLPMTTPVDDSPENGDLSPEALHNQEWCDQCSHEEVPDDDVEAGMPRDVVDVSLEIDPGWDEAWGQGPQYEVTHLACGHTLARLC
ncbi:hypothetical protein [Brevibacterium oceani]|uniref:hypothetical protein n=1 Tax=Brevibacterium oceani TaxID=358099 RepID=UPI0015E68DF6|nr:hypothetical protein [Brevibacterium oceani]